MSKKLKKHGYAERLKYMHMLENGYTAITVICYYVCHMCFCNKLTYR